MDLAIVLAKGIEYLISKRIFKNEFELECLLCEALELDFIDLELEEDKHYIRVYTTGFELNDKKYRLRLWCNVLINESLAPYVCLVFENNNEEVSF